MKRRIKRRIKLDSPVLKRLQELEEDAFVNGRGATSNHGSAIPEHRYGGEKTGL
jgi:hypothetical protein